MIITLKGADFSGSNIGTLSTWRISTVLGAGATYNGVTSVDRDPVTGFTGTVTIAEGYEIGSAGVTVTMGGEGQAFTHVGNVITINIAAVTGNITIKVPTVNTSTGEEDDGGNGEISPNYPTETTWYVSSTSATLASEINSTNSSNGWAYASGTEQEAIRNKPINALQITTTSTSGDVYVAIADSHGAKTVHDLTKGTFTKSGTSKEVVTVLLEKTITLTDDQYLIFEPAGVAPTRNYNLYYSGTAQGGNGFLSRIPVDTSGASSAWKANSGMNIGISVGYYVNGSSDGGNNTPSEPTNTTWYTSNLASTSFTDEVKLDNKTFGWALSDDVNNSFRNKTINAIRFATTSTSGTVTIGVAKKMESGTEITNVQTTTFTKSGASKELVTAIFSTPITLASDEWLVIEPSDVVSSLNYNHYYGLSGGPGFYSRVPQDRSGQNKTVALFSSYNIGYDVGYVP